MFDPNFDPNWVFLFFPHAKTNRTKNSFQIFQKLNLSFSSLCWTSVLWNKPKKQPHNHQWKPQHRSTRTSFKVVLSFISGMFGISVEFWRFNSFQLCWKWECYICVAACVKDCTFVPKRLNCSCCASVANICILIKFLLAWPCIQPVWTVSLRSPQS